MAEPISKYIENGKLIKGHQKTRLYRTWRHMKERCLNPNNNRYSLYGGRGITVCEEWARSFNSFFEWAIENGYEENLTIDRIDTNGNYCPENCRWADSLFQQNNKRSNRRITFNGETKTIAEWSRITGIKSRTLLYRLNNGLKIEDIFSRHMTSLSEAQAKCVEKRKLNGTYHNIEINGITKTLGEWAETYQISRKTVTSRILRGWDEEKAITEPIKRITSKIQK